MSIPLDRLYHFLHDHCNHDVIIYHFYPHGSKNLGNIVQLFEYKRDVKFYTVPHVLFHDQEPLDFDLWPNVSPSFLIESVPYSRLKVKVGSIGVHDKPILVHSELNSDQLQTFVSDGAIPVYYWSHALIALDWFRYAEFDLQLTAKQPKKTFLIYNRAWQGTREYRLKFAELLVKNKLHSFCKTSFQPVDNNMHYSNHKFANPNLEITKHNLEDVLLLNTAHSAASADYDSQDYIETSVEIVLETLFDDQRWHLTEKTLRPIAVGQPFVICSTPGILNYLRSYGFETFAQCWDESYDLESNPVIRLEKIMQTMHEIKSGVDLQLAYEIAQRNRQRFFSKEFVDQVLLEYKSNMAKAVDQSYQHQSAAYFTRHCNSMKAMKDTIPLPVFDYIDNLSKT